MREKVGKSVNIKKKKINVKNNYRKIGNKYGNEVDADVV